MRFLLSSRLLPSFLLIATAAAQAATTAAEPAPAPDNARVNIMRAIEAAKDEPFLEPKGDLKAMLLKQNPELAAPDCGVRYKQLAVAHAPGKLTLLIAPQGRCRALPGMPPQWVLQIGVEQPQQVKK